MSFPRVALLLLGLTFGALVLPAQTPPASSAKLKFRGIEYFHRWSKDQQHEFTPAGQEDLQKWADMITLVTYPKVKDGEGLAQTASAVLEAYKQAKAVVVRTNSLPASPTKLAEHYAAVVFGRPEFIEAVFVRFVVKNGVGTAIIHSHRLYGAKIGDQASAWLKANGDAIEKELFALETVPVMTAKK